MIANPVNMQPKPHELNEQFFQRRSLAAGRVASHAGKWGTRWAHSTVAWHNHLIRQHDVHAWAPKLYTYHALDWVEEQRHLHNYHRTCTRVKVGKVAERWQEGYDEARQFDIVASKSLYKLASWNLT